MKTTAVISFDDVVFANRNQMYGAYQLRKKYYKSITKAVFISLAILTLAFKSHEMMKNESIEKITEVTFKPTGTILIEPFEPEKNDYVEPQTRLATEVERSMQHTTPTITEREIEEVVTSVELDDSNPGDVTNEIGLEPGSIIDVANNTTEMGIEDEDKVFDAVMEGVIYPGGFTSLMSDLSRNLVYPSVSLEEESEGKVWVQFVVGKNGKIRDAKVLKSTADEYCEKEALRVVYTLKDFEPAKNNGHVCASYFVLPIQFKIGR